MIKFENGMLVLDSTATKEDVDAINEFAKNEREVAVQLIKQKLINAWSQYEEVQGGDYLWTMREIFDIINDKFFYKPAVYDNDYIGKLPDDAVKQ